MICAKFIHMILSFRFSSLADKHETLETNVQSYDLCAIYNIYG